MSSEQGTVSAASSAAPSPQPLHNPAQAAVVHIPEAPLGNHTNANAAMGQKALLAKKMVKRRFVGIQVNIMDPWHGCQLILS
jgi:hypothetical protein